MSRSLRHKHYTDGFLRHRSNMARQMGQQRSVQAQQASVPSSNRVPERIRRRWTHSSFWNHLKWKVVGGLSRTTSDDHNKARSIPNDPKAPLLCNPPSVCRHSSSDAKGSRTEWLSRNQRTLYETRRLNHYRRSWRSENSTATARLLATLNGESGQCFITPRAAQQGTRRYNSLLSSLRLFYFLVSKILSRRNYIIRSRPVHQRSFSLRDVRVWRLLPSELTFTGDSSRWMFLSSSKIKTRIIHNFPHLLSLNIYTEINIGNT